MSLKVTFSDAFGETADEDESEEVMRSGQKHRSTLSKLVFHIRWQLSFDLVSY